MSILLRARRQKGLMHLLMLLIENQHHQQKKLKYNTQRSKENGPRHEHKLLSQLRVNAPRSPSNWFYWVGLVASRFYWLKVSPKSSSIERFPMLFI